MLVFCFLATIVIALGVLSLRSGFSFAAYIRGEMARPLPDFTPFASVLVPCRGLEQGLRENLAALFQQNYQGYEIIFVADNPTDPSLAVINELIQSDARKSSIPASIVISGPATESGQKVHNLRTAVATIDHRAEVIVFVDSDARPHRTWLTSLVAPLADENIGASTGYRWFLPVRGVFASELRSVWNASIASALGADGNRNFAWGGSTAIRKSTFERLKISERWRGSVSDDFTITRVLHEAKLPIHFVPACLIASVDDCSARELIEFTNRQLQITRAYASHLWKPLLIGSLLFCAAFFGGIAIVIVRALQGVNFVLPLALVMTIFFLGAAKAFVRLRAVSIPLAVYGPCLRKSWTAHLFLWPIASALFLYNALHAAVSRRITWRGITYDLKSPTEAVIIAPQSDKL